MEEKNSVKLKPLKKMTDNQLIMDSLARLLVDKGISKTAKHQLSRIEELWKRAGHKIKIINGEIT